MDGGTGDTWFVQLVGCGYNQEQAKSRGGNGSRAAGLALKIYATEMRS